MKSSGDAVSQQHIDPNGPASPAAASSAQGPGGQVSPPSAPSSSVGSSSSSSSSAEANAAPRESSVPMTLAEQYAKMRSDVLLAISSIGVHSKGRLIDVGGVKVKVLTHIAEQWDVITATDAGKITIADAMRQIVWAGQRGFYLYQKTDFNNGAIPFFTDNSSSTLLKIRGHYAQYLDERVLLNAPLVHPTLEQRAAEYAARMPIVIAKCQAQAASPSSGFTEANAIKELESIILLGQQVMTECVDRLKKVIQEVKRLSAPDTRAAGFLQDTLDLMLNSNHFEDVKFLIEGFSIIFNKLLSLSPMAELRNLQGETGQLLADVQQICSARLQETDDAFHRLLAKTLLSLTTDMFIPGTGRLKEVHEVLDDTQDASSAISAANRLLKPKRIVRDGKAEEKQDRVLLNELARAVKNIPHKELTVAQGIVFIVGCCVSHGATAFPLIQAGLGAMKQVIDGGKVMGRHSYLERGKMIEDYGKRLLELSGNLNQIKKAGLDVPAAPILGIATVSGGQITIVDNYFSTNYMPSSSSNSGSHSATAYMVRQLAVSVSPEVFASHLPPAPTDGKQAQPAVAGSLSSRAPIEEDSAENRVKPRNF